MTHPQSMESAVAIGKLETEVNNLREDISELKDDMKWVRRTMIGLIISLLLVAASVVMSTL